MEKATFDFDLCFEHADSDYVCRVTDSPVGPARAVFSAPFTWRQLDTFWRTIAGLPDSKSHDERSRENHSDRDGEGNGFGIRLFSSLRRSEPEPSGGNATELATYARTHGEQFFHALFRDDVGACLRACRKVAHEQGKCLSIRVDLTETPALRDLPWTFLYDPDDQEFLSLSSRTHLLGHMNLMHNVQPLNMKFPLRALVVIAGPNTFQPVDAEREWLALLDTLDFLALDKRLILERLAKPTLLDLQRRLRQGEYHIVHFIGHSQYDKHTGEGQLIFEDEVGRSRFVSGQHLGALLHDHYSLRMVCLSSVEGIPFRPGTSAFPIIAQNLVQRGIGVVTFPQFSVPLNAWLPAMRALYEAVTGLQPIEESMSAARAAMLDEDGPEEDVFWGAPALISRLPDGYLFNDGSLQFPRIPREAMANVESRLNSLRIRTANLETMARWGTELSDRSRPNRR